MNSPPGNSSGFTAAWSGRVSSTAAGLSDPAWALLLFLVAINLYLKALGSDFVVDDGILLVHNPWVQSFAYLQKSFTQDFWGFLGARGSTGFYRPLIMVTLFLERQRLMLSLAAPMITPLTSGTDSAR